jgi:hypothetical protein
MRHIGTAKWSRGLCVAPLAALMFTVAWPAMAQKGRLKLYLLPPPEFDVPYTGKLTIWRVRSEKEMLEIFVGRESNWLPIARAVGINRKAPGQPAPKCQIYVIADDALKARGVSLNFVLRHELAHCNGDISPDHVGWKLVRSDIPTTMPQLPESTRWLLASPSPCHPPSRRIEPCEGGSND